MTTYTNSLKLGKPAVGATGWGTILNAQLIDMVEEAVAGFATINTWSGDTHTLTQSNGTTNASRCAVLRLTDTGGAISGSHGQLVLLNTTKTYIITNETGHDVKVHVTSVVNTAITIPTGKTTTVYVDGTNVVKSGISFIPSLEFAGLKGTGAAVVTDISTTAALGTSDSLLCTQNAIKTYVDKNNIESSESQVLPSSPDISGLKQTIANGATTTAFQFKVLQNAGTGDKNTSTQLDLSLRYDMFTAGTAAAINRAVANMKIFRKAPNSSIKRVFDFGQIAATGTKVGSVTTNKKKLQVTGDVTEFLDSSSYIATTAGGANKARVFAYNFDVSTTRTNIYYISADTNTTDSVFTTSAGCHANPHGWAGTNDLVEMFPLQDGTINGAFQLDEIILAGTDVSTGQKTIKFPSMHVVRGYTSGTGEEEFTIQFECGPGSTDGGINVYTLGVLQTTVPGETT
jgi:hypothetical protein